MRPLLIYIHGFNSSSHSQKAEKILRYLMDNDLPVDFIAPTFACYPGECHKQLQQLIVEQQRRRENIALIGNSLGGFMATSVVQNNGLKAVLVNPVVYPYKLIGEFLGENVNLYTGEQYTLRKTHINELRALEPASLNYPEHLLVMLQTGDEILDYRIAKAYYNACPQIIEEGGDHSFQNFDRHIPKLLQFLELINE